MLSFNSITNIYGTSENIRAKHVQIMKRQYSSAIFLV